MSTRFLSSTSQPIPFFLKLTSDHVTGATGKTVTVTISKSGGSFAAAAAAVSEIGNGWYQLAGNATDTNTLGPLLLHAVASACDPVDIAFDVVAVNPFSTDISLTSLSIHAATGSGFTVLSDDSPAITIGPAADLQSAVYCAGSIDLSGNYILGNLLHVDNASTCNTVTGSVGAVLGNVVGNINGDVVGEVQGSVASVIGAVGSVVGNVGGNVVGSVGSIPSVTLSSAYDAAKTCAQAATALSTAVWTNTIAGRLDAAISSRSALVLSDVVNGVLNELLSGHTTSGTVGAALRLIRQALIGKRSISGNSLTIYAEDNSTVLVTLDLTPHGGPFTAQTP